MKSEKLSQKDALERLAEMERLATLIDSTTRELKDLKEQQKMLREDIKNYQKELTELIKKGTANE